MLVLMRTLLTGAELGAGFCAQRTAGANKPKDKAKPVKRRVSLKDVVIALWVSR
jgi:hypothetical protein